MRLQTIVVRVARSSTLVNSPAQVRKLTSLLLKFFLSASKGVLDTLNFKKLLEKHILHQFFCEHFTSACILLSKSSVPCTKSQVKYNVAANVGKVNLEAIIFPCCSKIPSM